jgi:hypothetical protein
MVSRTTAEKMLCESLERADVFSGFLKSHHVIRKQINRPASAAARLKPLHAVRQRVCRHYADMNVLQKIWILR